MKVTIDPFAGFCFGVERAIRVAEENMNGETRLQSLGDLVHNEEEKKRLAEEGLNVLSQEKFVNLKHGRVMFRAHGEPPKSYKIACRNNTKVIDATCPVVKKLQSRVEKVYDEVKKKDGILLIFGKKGHPEVIGLLGHSGDKARVVQSPNEVRKLNLPTFVRLFTQTTMGTEDFLLLQDAIRRRLLKLYPDTEVDFKSFNTICKQVSGRERTISTFAEEHQLILFVAGKKSSNGKHLFSIASKANQNSHYISGMDEIDPRWFRGIDDVGITGATSTPDWQMQKARDYIEKL